MLKKIISCLLLINICVPLSMAEEEIKPNNLQEHKIEYNEDMLKLFSEAEIDLEKYKTKDTK